MIKGCTEIKGYTDNPPRTDILYESEAEGYTGERIVTVPGNDISPSYLVAGQNTTMPTNSSPLIGRKAEELNDEQLQWDIIQHLKNGNSLDSLSIFELEQVKSIYGIKHFYCRIMPQLSISQISYFYQQQDFYRLALKNIPKEKFTIEMCTKILTKNITNFKYIPKELITLEQVLDTISKKTFFD